MQYLARLATKRKAEIRKEAYFSAKQSVWAIPRNSRQRTHREARARRRASELCADLLHPLPRADADPRDRGVIGTSATCRPSRRAPAP